MAKKTTSSGEGSRGRTRGKRNAADTPASKTGVKKRSTRARSGKVDGIGSEPALGALDAAAVSVGRALGRTTAAVADHLPWGRTDGLTLLERDHREFESLLKQGVEVDETAVADRCALLARLAPLLTTHEAMEEQVLYPALKSHPEAKDIVLEGYQEHHVADVLLRELKTLPPSDERWGAKLKVLKESLEHHIEEEESDMFRKARAAFSQAELDDIGAQMNALRNRTVESK